MKTWGRYEAGSAIRNDKRQAVCRVLGWLSLPSEGKAPQHDWREHIDVRDIDEAMRQTYVYQDYGAIGAYLFSDALSMMRSFTEEALEELSHMPKGSHVGELEYVDIGAYLPPQFLTRYDYEFAHGLKYLIEKISQKNKLGVKLTAHTVLDEVALTAIHFQATALSDKYSFEGLEDIEDADDDGFDDDEKYKADGSYFLNMFLEMECGDEDCKMLLWNDHLPEDHAYHFSHWLIPQFFLDTFTAVSTGDLMGYPRIRKVPDDMSDMPLPTQEEIDAIRFTAAEEMAKMFD